jgi:hypothetical protein
MEGGGGAAAHTPSPLFREDLVEYDPTEGLLWLCEKEGYSKGESEAVLTILGGVLTAEDSAAYNGSSVFAANKNSERTAGTLGDVDISFGSPDTTSPVDRSNPPLPLKKLLKGLKGAVAGLPAGVKPTFGVEEWGSRFIKTTPPGPLGTCGSGFYVNIPLIFPSGKVLTVQFSERHSSWAPIDLVRTFWARGGTMEVFVTASAGGGWLDTQPPSPPPWPTSAGLCTACRG